MKLKPTLRFIMGDISIKIIPLYYLASICLYSALYFTGDTSGLAAPDVFGSLLASSFFLIFVLTAMTANRSLRFLVQVGISRDTIIVANLLRAVILSAAISMADRLLSLYMTFLTGGFSQKYIDPVTEFGVSDSCFPYYLLFEFSLGFGCILFMILLALFCSMIWIRLKLLYKLLFLILSLFIVIIYTDTYYRLDFIAESVGYDPLMTAVVIFVFFFGSALISYILSARRVPVRD